MSTMWLAELFLDPNKVASNIIVILIVGALGLGLGAVKYRGLSLGIAGVLFSGLFFGHLGLKVNESVLGFASEFGLILFVYAVGLQVGPGFFNSLKTQGMALNLSAAGIVLIGAVTTVGLSHFLGVTGPAAVGIFSGATTNTPSLAAAREALREHRPPTESLLQSYAEMSPAAAAALPPINALSTEQKNEIASEVLKLPGLAYAIAYPFGVVGIIIAMLLVKLLFRIDLTHESEILKLVQKKKVAELSRINLRVTNPNLDGVKIADIPALSALKVVISRILQDEVVRVANTETKLRINDILLVVGKPKDLEQLRVIVGEVAQADLSTMPSQITVSKLVVTKKEVLGKTIDDLDFLREHDVQITRIRRADIEFPQTAGMRLQYADRLVAVGTPEAIEIVAKALGNSTKQLDHPEVVSICLGIIFGVIIGSYPIPIPGLPEPVRLGLAGGPLVAAIIFSRIGRIGPLIAYLPTSANFVLRELGIVLFLASVGLRGGDRFVATLTQGNGLTWMAMGAVVTLLPLLLVGFFARIVLKLNYLHLVGLLAGSMTDPPALYFSNSLTQSEAPSFSYATVYPLTMILRVLCAQLLVMLMI